MKKQLLVLMLAMACGGAMAAEPPNQADLKSTYCIAVDYKLLEAMNSTGDDLSPEMQVLKNEQIGKIQSDISRMNLYLLPRMQRLDNAGLAMFAKMAQADLEQFNNDSAKCASGCGVNIFECVKKCGSGSEVAKRLLSCETTLFLPH